MIKLFWNTHNEAPITDNLNNSFLLDKNNIKNYILPSFTKKIFKSVLKQ